MLQESSGGGMGVRDATISGSRLLLVDDDPALLLALSGTLQNRLGPCTVDACESGMQALDLVKAHPYDTIISDVRMPGMNGWQFLRARQAIAVRHACLLDVRQRRSCRNEGSVGSRSNGLFCQAV